MTLRGRFRIIGSHREVSRKVSGNIGKILETSEMFENVSVKELCQGID
jgi:hypothetical protein